MRLRIAGTSLLAIACALVLASPAAAAITSSQITSPSSPTFGVFDEDNPGIGPNAIEVEGTSNGAGGEKVDLYCYEGTGITHASLGEATLASDGSFSVASASLSGIEDKLCRLRAVPAASPPSEASKLSPFAGPVMAIGSRESKSIPSGPNSGSRYDFELDGQQVSAGDSYSSASHCGLRDSTLFNASLEKTTTTFACNDSFVQGENVQTPAASTRSEIQVDGANAYLADAAFEINPAASGFPALFFSFSLERGNGNLQFLESEPVVKCAFATYPPTAGSCPSFVGTGIRDDRFVEQTDDGHLVKIEDRFFSTDAAAHSVDLLAQNDQSFGGHGETVSYRFPGESSFSKHAVGSIVSFSGTAPATTFIRVEGAPEGDQETGQGAIVLDRPASPATFNAVGPSGSDFYFHETVPVPAGGSALARAAYAQGYTSAEVEALARKAEAAYQPEPPESRPAAAPSNRFRLGSRRFNRKNGTVQLILVLPAPGHIVLRGAKVRAVIRTVRKAGRTVVTVRPKRMQLKKLKRRHRERVRFGITFTPTGGTPAHKTVSLVLVHRR